MFSFYFFRFLLLLAWGNILIIPIILFTIFRFLFKCIFKKKLCCINFLAFIFIIWNCLVTAKHDDAALIVIQDVISGNLSNYLFLVIGFLFLIIFIFILIINYLVIFSNNLNFKTKKFFISTSSFLLSIHFYLGKLLTEDYLCLINDELFSSESDALITYSLEYFPFLLIGIGISIFITGIMLLLKNKKNKSE